MIKRDVDEAFSHLLGLVPVHPQLLWRARDFLKSLMIVIWVCFDPLNLVAFVERVGEQPQEVVRRLDELAEDVERDL
ncbi:hypothetical protein D3C80_2075940 [compost metagenome]